jgi:hypothetical protein
LTLLLPFPHSFFSSAEPLIPRRLRAAGTSYKAPTHLALSRPRRGAKLSDSDVAEARLARRATRALAAVDLQSDVTFAGVSFIEIVTTAFLNNINESSKKSLGAKAATIDRGQTRGARAGDGTRF